VIKNQHLRLAKLEVSQRSTDMIHSIYLEDVEEFKVEDNPNAGKRNIGFKQNN